MICRKLSNLFKLVSLRGAFVSARQLILSLRGTLDWLISDEAITFLKTRLLRHIVPAKAPRNDEVLSLACPTKVFRPVRKYVSKRARIDGIVFIVLGLWLVISLAGCEAFVRKFTRKPKDEVKEAPLLEPQQYPDGTLTKEQLYRDYYTFWESWTDELEDSLVRGTNFKKLKQCANEALDNLAKLQSLLKEEKGIKLQKCVADFTKVKDRVFSGDLTYSERDLLKDRVSRIKNQVHRDFVYSKAKNDLK